MEAIPRYLTGSSTFENSQECSFEVSTEPICFHALLYLLLPLEQLALESKCRCKALSYTSFLRTRTVEREMILLSQLHLNRNLAEE